MKPCLREDYSRYRILKQTEVPAAEIPAMVEMKAALAAMMAESQHSMMF